MTKQPMPASESCAIADLTAIIERLYERSNYPAWLLADLAKLLSKMEQENAALRSPKATKAPNAR